jgi:frataxin-like iron-binding protein CyaY
MLACAAVAQPAYDVGDWTSYKDFRYARSVDVGMNEIFVATSGGILEYHLLRQQWYDPWVVGYGLSEPVTLDDPMLLFYDPQTAYLWVATRTQLLQFDTNTERWRIAGKNLWGPLDRVVNLGAGGNSFYVETIPADVFANIFTYGTPIPSPVWHNYVTRYKGSNTFGGFMIDTDIKDPADVRWRGLRSRVPLNESELFGALGFPPLNFPSLILPPGYVLHSDGLILDPALRGAPITDWLIDRFGNLFATHWGTGVMRADLRTSRVELNMLGPAGNDIRSLQVSDDAVWMGGFNSGERTGISRASRDLLAWNSFETRDNSRLRSTSVYDFADWNGGIWIATDDGLSSFNKKKAEWTRFGTGQNLQDDKVRALAATDSELWIGNARGLAVMTLPGQEIWTMSVPGIELNGVTKLAFFKDTLFVATPSGLFKGKVGKREFDYMELDPKLLNAPVLDISVSGSEVWLVTTEGVMRYEPLKGASKSWYAGDWLQGAEPSCLLAMPDFVWVGTRENGFYRFRQDTGEWIQYSTRDGLVDNHVQVIRADGGDLLIGTANGLTRFYWNRPGRIR